MLPKEEMETGMSKDQTWPEMVFVQFQPRDHRAKGRLCPMSLSLTLSVSHSSLNHWFSLSSLFGLCHLPNLLKSFPQGTMLGGDLGGETVSWEALIHE